MVRKILNTGVSLGWLDFGEDGDGDGDQGIWEMALLLHPGRTPAPVAVVEFEAFALVDECADAVLECGWGG